MRPKLPEIVIKQLKVIISKLKREVNQPADRKDVDNSNLRLEHLLQILLKCNELYSVDPTLIDVIRSACAAYKIPDRSLSYAAPKSEFDRRGRPSFMITKPQLELYLKYKFSIPKISTMLSVSRSTIKRRLRVFNLAIKDCYTNINDEVLDKTIANLTAKHPNCGYRRMDGFLSSHSVRVTEKRIRDSMKRVDPEGVLVRHLQLNLVNRREYKVLEFCQCGI